MISKPQQAMMIVAATAFMRLSRGQLPICHELPIMADGAARAAAPDGAHRGCPGGPDAALFDVLAVQAVTVVVQLSCTIVDGR